MALIRVFHGVINVYTHMDKWRITLRKRNTYGVERNHLQNKMGGNTT